MTLAEASQLNIAALTGPYILGGLLSYGLFGILIVQIFYILALFDLGVTIMWTVFMWQLFADNWGQLSVLSARGGISSTAAAIPLLSGIGIHGAQIGATHFSEMDAEVSTWLGGSTVCDFLITSVLVFKLFSHGRRSISPVTRSMLFRLITLTVETGLVTALTALSELLLFIIFRTNNLHFIPLLMLSKMYSNCLLATLNARVVIHPETGDTQHPLWIDLDQHRTFFGSISSSLPPQVHVDRSVHRDHDIELQIVLSPGTFPDDKASISATGP
ncbi:hypothetical protein C8R41DRAFT_969098 [Lentinula lateritia]|uniref:DUF6534 domain-containing protein n=1 Tax=Lentinula lateritia TaxID=40482 RepID=A0ABQ8V459_9AGAR|nr:hypothetical protein C8R41DRAFT_969098 [Lentinula lateritia]